MSGLRSDDNQHQHIHLESQSPRQVSPFLGLFRSWGSKWTQPYQSFCLGHLWIAMEPFRLFLVNGRVTTHSVFQDVVLNSAVLTFNHRVLNTIYINMNWIVEIYSKTSPFVNQMGLFRLKTLTLIHLYFLFQRIL